MNAVVRHDADETGLPTAVARRNINEAQWRTLMNNLYPGASGESVLMVWDYCMARKLDPLKKPCHIVPMEVKDKGTDRYIWRDVVMPGIYEYRTTAQRTGEYMGHSKPEYGPWTEHAGVVAPEWCAITIYRWSGAAKQRTEYPVQVFFREAVATKRDGSANSRWKKAPAQMLTKCTEAAGLREGFPDEIGGEPTMEEMEGKVLDVSISSERDEYVKRFRDALDVDLSEEAKAEGISLINDEVCSNIELYNSIWDKIASRDRSAIKKYIDQHHAAEHAKQMLPNGRVA